MSRADERRIGIKFNSSVRNANTIVRRIDALLATAPAPIPGETCRLVSVHDGKMQRSSVASVDDDQRHPGSVLSAQRPQCLTTPTPRARPRSAAVPAGTQG